MAKNKTLGYKLHKQRILFSGGKVTRSIKYPLKVFKDTLQDIRLYQNFIAKIINDDLKIRGEVNLPDYLNSLSNNKKIYTLFDFWLDSLRAGIIFMPKVNKLIDFLYKIYQKEKPADKIWGAIDEQLKKFFNKQRFIEKFILPKSIRKGKKTAASLRRDLIDCLLENYKNIKEKNEIEIKDAQAKKLIDFITNSFFGKDNKLLLNSQEQANFWKQFNLDKSLLKESQSSGELKDITCFIIPELVSPEIETVEDLIKIREQWINNKGLKKDYLREILGLTENFNAYSNYLGKFFRTLLKKETEEIYKVFFTIIPDIREYKEKIIKAIKYLSDKAKNLGEPELVSSWAEYRSVFGGKIQSWYSNFENRDIKIKQQKEKLREEIKNILNFLFSLKKEKDSFSGVEDLEEIEFFLKRLENFLEEADLGNQENFSIFEDLIGLIRRKVNIFYLQNLVDEKNTPVDKYEVDGVKIFLPIYEKVYKPISFYGQAIFKNNDKIIQKTIPIINDGIDIIFILIKELIPSFSISKTFITKKKEEEEKDEDLFRSLLEFFWDKYKEKTINTKNFQDKYEDIITRFLEPPNRLETLLKEAEKYVFFKSEFAKGSQKIISIKRSSFIETEEDLIRELTSYLLSFPKETLLKDSSLLIDFLELAKKITSLVIRFNEKREFETERLPLENFEKAKKYIKTFNILKAPKKDFSYIINSLIFSEIKGAATLFSKKEYLVKYSAQVINSNEKFKLFLMFKDFSINSSFPKLSPLSLERKKFLNSPHIYLLSPHNVLKDKKKKESKFLRVDKKNLEFFPIKDGTNHFFLKICSSYYQTQFLDKYLFRPKSWENIDIELSEWSFIVEKKYQIEWDILAKKPVFKEKKQEENRLYISIPFLITSISQGPAAIKKISSDRLNYPILGIDVGEYGLAWCLTKINEEKIEILDKGFIEDRNIAAIKDNFSLIQQKAKKGIFNISSDAVSEVRKNAVGGLRNKIHAILTNYKSSIIYEFSISNFETGSGRTTKIYNSIKKSDIPPETDADKKQKEHVWGVKYEIPGTHISAYGSSYTCYKCKKSLFEIKKEDLKDVIFRGKEGNILVFTSPYGKIYGFSEGKPYKENEPLDANDKTFKQFRKIISDFARPPIQSEVLLRIKNHRNKEELENFKKRRGNSAIFVCPFCLNETDADIQAALMMAIRGYLKFKKNLSKIKGDKEEKIDWFQESLSFLRRDGLFRLLWGKTPNSFCLPLKI